MSILDTAHAVAVMLGRKARVTIFRRFKNQFRLELHKGVQGAALFTRSAIWVEKPRITSMENGPLYEPSQQPILAFMKATPLFKKVLARWRDQLQQANADAKWVRSMATMQAERESAATGIRHLLAKFQSGNCDVEQFKREFHQQSNGDWKTFGAGGYGGAMFLNMLVPYAPDRDELTRQLKFALALPIDEASAQQKLQKFLTYLQALIRSGAPNKTPSESSMGFFVSFFWHIQDPQRWPIYYPSVRDALINDGLFQKDADRVQSYLAFRRTVLELGTSLGLSPLWIEQLPLRFPESKQADESAVVRSSGAASSRRKYGLDEACRDLFVERDEIERIIALLRHKKNIVLQGPPGVGKTFVAKRLAYALIEDVDPERVKTVQFHQSYSYEDFVRGYRPTDAGGFVLKPGPFFLICNRAHKDRGNDFVLIIDEINRGNLSKILGDLMMLIEADKRDFEWASALSYASDEEAPFFVPPNLYIIGTMNTADRSLALVDYALRRRFAFVTLSPGFDTVGLRDHFARIGISESLAERIRSAVESVNKVIRREPQLGEGFQIGHSYFCRPPEGQAPNESWYQRVISTELKPLLHEYFFDAPERAQECVEVLLAHA